jgi:hypothetical protein
MNIMALLDGIVAFRDERTKWLAMGRHGEPMLKGMQGHGISSRIQVYIVSVSS